MTNTETVTADQLSIGDRVLAFGLEWEVRQSDDLINLAICTDDFEDFIYPNKWNKTFERIIPPKRYKRTEVLEYRSTKADEVFYLDHDPSTPSYKSWGDPAKRYVVTSVEGAENPNAKLTKQKVERIRKALDRGVSGAELARKYGVTTSAISHIKRGARW